MALGLGPALALELRLAVRLRLRLRLGLRLREVVAHRPRQQKAQATPVPWPVPMMLGLLHRLSTAHPVRQMWVMLTVLVVLVALWTLARVRRAWLAGTGLETPTRMLAVWLKTTTRRRKTMLSPVKGGEAS